MHLYHALPLLLNEGFLSAAAETVTTSWNWSSRIFFIFSLDGGYGGKKNEKKLTLTLHDAELISQAMFLSMHW